MYNWSTDEKVVQQDPEGYAVWRLEQLINFGLHQEKINVSELRQYWDRLQLDPRRRHTLEFLLYGKKHSL